MKKFIFLNTAIGFLLMSFVPMKAQTMTGFKTGEHLKYRFHYGSLNAGYATLDVKTENLNGRPHFLIKGYGYSTGLVKAVFKVQDVYQTYIDKATGTPTKFIRNINEGGYRKNRVIYFNQKTKKVTVDDKKNGTKKSYSVTSEIQDILSAFYFLRNQDLSKKKTGDFVSMNVFIDEEAFPFKLKIMGRETIKTKYGKVNCIKLQPMVQSGRIFKAKESVSLWVTDDSNYVPIQIKASLLIGSLKADLDDYRNVVTPIKFY